MDFLTESQVTGHRVQLSRTHARHLSGKINPQKVIYDPTKFSDLVRRGLAEVNNSQNESSLLMQQMITDPDSVDSHDITLAMAKANMSLSIAKSVIDRAIRAYREISTLR
jgi:flagellar hook-basal body complex protein FliE